MGEIRRVEEALVHLVEHAAPPTDLTASRRPPPPIPRGRSSCKRSANPA
jgi:hypothetical protein